MIVYCKTVTSSWGNYRKFIIFQRLYHGRCPSWVIITLTKLTKKIKAPTVDMTMLRQGNRVTCSTADLNKLDVKLHSLRYLYISGGCKPYSELSIWSLALHVDLIYLSNEVFIKVLHFLILSIWSAFWLFDIQLFKFMYIKVFFFILINLWVDVKTNLLSLSSNDTLRC